MNNYGSTTLQSSPCSDSATGSRPREDENTFLTNLLLAVDYKQGWNIKGTMGGSRHGYYLLILYLITHHAIAPRSNTPSDWPMPMQLQAMSGPELYGQMKFWPGAFSLFYWFGRCTSRPLALSNLQLHPKLPTLRIGNANATADECNGANFISIYFTVL